MDFEEKQHNIFTENQQPIEPDIRDLCKDVSYSCNHYSKKLDTMKMSKEIFDVYSLHVNIIETTNELWQNLLSIITRKNKFDVEDLCFSIMNLENCDGLNKFYHSFNIESNEYMKDYIGQQSHDNYLDLVKKFFIPFDYFLQLSLPSLENDIKSLLIVIDTHDGSGSFSHDHYKKSYVGDIVNIMILKYLRQLQNLFSDFKLNDPSSELVKRKKQIESRIERAIESNVEILKKSKPFNIVKSSTTSTTEPAIIYTSTLPPFDDTFSATIDDSTNTKLPTSSTSLKTTTTVFKNSTENHFYQSNATNEDYVTKPTFAISENPNLINNTISLSNTTTSFDEIIKLSKNDTSDTLPANRSSDVRSTSVSNWIIFGSTFSLIGFIIVIAFGVKKFISRRNKSRDNRSIRLNNEKSNSVAFNKY